MIIKDIHYVGVNDHQIDLFEGQYRVPNGMAYNSYVILDQKIAVMDSVDARFSKQWLANVEATLDGAQPDYLVVQHMEPDHSSSIVSFVERYPDAIVVSGEKAFTMMKQFYRDDYAHRRMIIKDGDMLNLGTHTLHFVGAPMVHWPEVVVTYDSYAHVLFSADAFGKFGALDVREDWEDEARRYYFGIVGKYGVQAAKLLDKAQELDIHMICPLHGPVLRENLEHYLSLYRKWAAYEAEREGVVIAYTSVYGNTRLAVQHLEDALRQSGCEVVTYDLARCDMARAMSEAFRYSKLVLATTTYNAEIFPFMREFIHELTERGFRGRTVGIIENGSWAPTAAKKIRSMLESSKNIQYTENTITIRSALTEQNKEQLFALAAELAR